MVGYINSNPTKDYYAVLSHKQGLNFTPIISRKLTTVPYAQVANMIGGAGVQGPRGAPGATGPAGPTSQIGNTGAAGRTGERGAPGIFDFENNLLIMTNQVPANGILYVDDGTNTSDGRPHLRYNLNGIWIDI